MNGGEKGVTALLAVLRTAPAAAACAACLDELDAYVAAQLDGADVQTQFPRTAAHLDGCVACAEAYALVYEMMWQEAAGLLPAAAAPPEPDLRFLRQATKPRLAVLAAAVTRAPGRLALRLDAALAALLAPPPAAALRAGEGGRYGRLLLDLPAALAAEAGLPFTLAAYADAQQPDACLLEVTVAPPGKSWPDLAGTPVTLTAAGQTWTAETDDWGTAVFEGVPVIGLVEGEVSVNG